MSQPVRLSPLACSSKQSGLFRLVTCVHSTLNCASSTTPSSSTWARPALPTKKPYSTNSFAQSSLHPRTCLAKEPSFYTTLTKSRNFGSCTASARVSSPPIFANGKHSFRGIATTHPQQAAVVSSVTDSQASTLDWNEFLRLRRIRRRYNLFSSLICSTGTTATGLSILAAISATNMDAFNSFGVDPFIVIGLSTAACGAVGWLIGPILGGSIFSLSHRRIMPQIASKEKDLFRRIKQHRVDPSNSSAGNPVPDYYGEKIGSVREYRTWLRDQRAYKKRRQSFV